MPGFQRSSCLLVGPYFNARSPYTIDKLTDYSRYAYQDWHQSPSFGIFDKNGNAIYDLYGC